MEIESWWIEICKRNDYDKWSGGYETIIECKKTLSMVDNENKNIIIDYLTDISINKGYRYALALAVLTEHLNDNSLNKIYQKASELRNDYKQDEHYYIKLLSVIGSYATDDKLDLVNEFLFDSKFNSNQSFIHWSLWPTNKDLFCKAYTYYFDNSEKWTECAIVQAFMNNPEALSTLKTYLQENKRNKIWEILRADLQKELKKDFWDKTDKEKIKKAIK
ncbi:MAG TPA: hypothetical protein VFK73_01335 [Paludibacter sp.]|nr:hypothetical protein [Paludibacter sp.]